MTGVGMFAVVDLDGGQVNMALMVQAAGKLTAEEQRARDLLTAGRLQSREMLASTIEEVGLLIPVCCAGCGGLADLPALVAEIRKGAVLS